MSQSQTHRAAESQNNQPERHYEYESLPDGPFIRYLILHPAAADTDPLACTLRTAHLDEIPHFEAISYVWGAPVKDQPITCNGDVTHITANLRDALRRVRLPDRPRTLWADSICINQANPQEQGRQVSLMGRIYKKSSCTLVCLGRSDYAHAPVVADLMAEVNSMIQLIFGREEFTWGPNSFPFPDKEDPLVLHRGWASFGVLLQQPWFRRGWVVQEAALGRNTRLLWADTDVGWLDLVRAYVWYVRRALKLPSMQQVWLSDLHLQGFYTQRSREAITFRPKGYTRPLSFLEILEHARFLGFAEPRDKIYAFLSFPCSSKMLPTILPNYEVRPLRLYHDFACEYLRTSGDLDILHFVHNDESALEDDVPSWVPRWDTDLYSSYTGTLNNYSSFCNRIVSPLSPPSVTVESDQTTLKVRAVIIDTVKFAAQGFDKSSTTPSDVASLWASLPTKSAPSPYFCSPLFAFITLFRCGVYRGRLAEWETRRSAYMRLLQRELTQEDAPYADAILFHEMGMENMHNKSFIVSDRGHYGLVPSIVREGDVCAIIFGTRSPFILRRTDQAGCYKFVGSALILSKVLDHNGYPMGLAGDENCADWLNWGLEEEEISLC